MRSIHIWVRRPGGVLLYCYGAWVVSALLGLCALGYAANETLAELIRREALDDHPRSIELYLWGVLAQVWLSSGVAWMLWQGQRRGRTLAWVLAVLSLSWNLWVMQYGYLGLSETIPVFLMLLWLYSPASAAFFARGARRRHCFKEEQQVAKARRVALWFYVLAAILLCGASFMGLDAALGTDQGLLENARQTGLQAGRDFTDAAELRTTSQGFALVLGFLGAICLRVAHKKNSLAYRLTGLGATLSVMSVMTLSLWMCAWLESIERTWRGLGPAEHPTFSFEPTWMQGLGVSALLVGCLVLGARMVVTGERREEGFHRPFDQAGTMRP